jgi:cob(I)alamin adenosyltransferase
VVRLNRIYTRTGDDGTSGLVDGTRLNKADARFAAIGSVDELNSILGLCAVALRGRAHEAAIARIQNDLFDLGADLATPKGASDTDDFAPSEMVLRIVVPQVDRLEQEIDALNENLPPLTSFILPGGGEAAARLHIARSIARRAERDTVALATRVAINPAVLAYLNRLSDYLFVLARAVNAEASGDVLWVPGANRG